MRLRRPLKPNGMLIDEASLEMAIRDAEKNPRITLWSKESAAILRYLRKTTPEFSISREAAKVLEEALRNKYPRLWKLVEKSLRGDASCLGREP